MHRQTAAASFFRQQGYLVLPGLISHDEVRRIRHTVIQIASGDRDVAGDGVTAQVVRIDKLTYCGEPFDGLVRSGTLLDAIQPLIGPNIEFIENRHNHVSLYRSSMRGRAHRDILQWTRSIVTVLVYLSDCSSPEAATRVVPGSHLWPCLGRPNNGGTWLDELPELASLEQQALPVPVAAGDVLCLDGLLYHSAGGGCGSGAGPRIVVTLAFRSVDELAPADTFPRHSVVVRGDRIYRGNPASGVHSSTPGGRCIESRDLEEAMESS